MHYSEDETLGTNTIEVLVRTACLVIECKWSHS